MWKKNLAKHRFLLKGLTGSLWLLRNPVVNILGDFFFNNRNNHTVRTYCIFSPPYLVLSSNMSGRDPFPSPKFENGFTLSGFLPQQKKTFDKPTHLAQTEEPWSRLHDTATLASTRRSVLHYEPQGQNDSLDFQLKSVYDHHKDFFWSKNQVLYQKETISEEQRKEEYLKQDMLEKEQQKDIRVWIDPQRRSIYSIK